MKTDAFGGLSQATWSRGGRDTEGICVGMCHKVWDFKLQDP